MQANNTDIIARLQREILSLGGIKSPVGNKPSLEGLEFLQQHFAHGIFPLGAIHEFVYQRREEMAVSTGFISGLISTFLPKEGIIIWISPAQTIFPPALLTFNIEPRNVIFIHPAKEKEIWWCIEEALRCPGVTAVVTEMQDINFTNSRRFQLAVEKTRVTGFILNGKPDRGSHSACISRWKITSLPSHLEDGMPGVGHPRWKVELQKVRNGQPGSWDIEWVKGAFKQLHTPEIISKEQRKTG